MAAKVNKEPEQVEENLTDSAMSAVPEAPSAVEGTAEAHTKPGSDDARQWYVIHCYSGYENKVRKNLEQRIETMAMKDKIFDVVIPTQEEIEVRVVNAARWNAMSSPDMFW